MVENDVLRKVEWSKEEAAWKCMKETGESTLKDEKWKTLTQAILNKLKLSSLSHLIRDFYPSCPTINEGIALWRLDIKESDSNVEWPDPGNRIRKDDFTDNLQNLLAKTPQSTNGLFNVDKLMSSLPSLRLMGEEITVFDEFLKKYNCLKVLILTMNFLTDFPGFYLPRNIKFLELSGNRFQSLDKLTEGIPQKLYYLGLGRNLLSNDWNMKVLQKYENLFFLNLEDNDIDNLDSLLEVLKEVKTLRSLSLIGNPCSLLIDYLIKINNRLPKLIILDGMNISDFETTNVEVWKGKLPEKIHAALDIHWLRLLGIPSPQKLKSKQKITDFKYQIEVVFPLIEQETWHKEASYFQFYEKAKYSFSGKNIGKIEKKKMDKLLPSSYSNFKSGSIDPDWSDGVQLKSEKIPWNQIINFSNDPISLFISKSNLTNLRDTLRSVLILKIYCIKGSGKELKKDIVAYIKAPMKQLKWTDDYHGYTWNKNQPNLLKPCSKESLPLIGRDSKTLKKKESKDILTTAEDVICHFGFRLRREYQLNKTGKT